LIDALPGNRSQETWTGGTSKDGGFRTHQHQHSPSQASLVFIRRKSKAMAFFRTLGWKTPPGAGAGDPWVFEGALKGSPKDLKIGGRGSGKNGGNYLQKTPKTNNQQVRRSVL